MTVPSSIHEPPDVAEYPVPHGQAPVLSALQYARRRYPRTHAAGDRALALSFPKAESQPCIHERVRHRGLIQRSAADKRAQSEARPVQLMVSSTPAGDRYRG